MIRIAETLGYRPNPMARGLKTARSGTVGLVIPDLTNPLFPPIVRGIEEVLDVAGYSALIVSTDNDPLRERAQIDVLRSRHVEGLIVATALVDHPLLEELQREHVLMVMANRRTHGIDAASITPDDATGVALAVQHLAELGHHRIAHLAGPCNTSTGVVRARAFRSAIRDLGLDDDPNLTLMCRRWSADAGAEAMRHLLNADLRISAVVAGNDLIALGCYDAFAERKLSCPQEMSVVGFNDIPFLDKLRPPLTTIAIPHQQIGAEAARLLLDAIAEPQRPARSVLLPVSLVVRGSTGPPPRGKPARSAQAGTLSGLGRLRSRKG